MRAVGLGQALSVVSGNEDPLAGFVLRLFICWQRLADKSVRPTRANLEAHHDWFRFQADAPDFFDALLDLIFQG